MFSKIWYSYPKDMKKTILYNKHIDLGGRIVEFGGFLLPLQYESIVKEHLWCRSSCAIFDTSHMAKFFFKGDKVSSELGRLLTVDIESMEGGQCRYCLILNERGGIIDDAVVYKFSDDRYMVVSNASTKDKVKNWYLSYIKEAEIEDGDVYLDKIDVQGSLSRDVLEDIFKIDLSSLSFYRFGMFNILGEETVISYSGYTGGVGYEIYINRDRTERVWDILLQDKRVKPAGLGARDSLRLEAGLPLYGNELDEDITPLEAGLGRFVDFSHSFIGKTALEERKPQKKIIYLVSETRQSPRHGYKIFSDNTEIGYITSGCFSPSLQKGIGAGYIKGDARILERVSVSDGKYAKIYCSVVSKKELVSLTGIKR